MEMEDGLRTKSGEGMGEEAVEQCAEHRWSNTSVGWAGLEVKTQ
jgi:hypothetical protein